MERTLLSYVWKYSKRQQIVLLFLTVLTFPILYVTLELPKRIINEAIGAESDAIDVLGWQFSQIEYLLLLCFMFLGAVLAWGIAKMRLNTMKGILAERLLRRFRYQLISRVLRFPLPHFRRTSQGEMVSIVTSEAEPLGGLMGDALAQPVFQAGQMLTILGFLFVQSFWLGLASIALIPLQAWLIPKLQRQVNALNMQRVREVRNFSERIGETVAGVEDLRANGAIPYTLAHYTESLGRLFTIRHRIYEKKYFMKFVNNLISQMTPFLFFSVGGYLVIEGQLTLGALVAALAAYKDLSSPWKELLAYYNQTQDMSVRYDTIIDRFDPPGMIDAALIEGRPDSYPRLNGPIVFENVTVRDPDGSVILDDLSLTIPEGASVAFAAANAVERRAIAQVLSRTILPSRGRVLIGGHDLNTLHQGAISARIGVSSSKPYLFKGNIEDNTRLPLRTLPALLPDLTDEAKVALAEARRVGNSQDRPDVPWLDLETGGFKNEADLYEWWHRITETLGTYDFLFQRGLDVAFDPAFNPRLAERLAELRPVAWALIDAEDLESAVHRFDPDRFNEGQAIGGNILYAIAKQRLEPEALARDPDFAHFLEETGLAEDVLALGADILAVIAVTFDSVGTSHPLFRRLGLQPELFEWLERINNRRASGGIESLCALDSLLLSALPFCFNASVFGAAFPSELKRKIVALRRRGNGTLGEWGSQTFSPLNEDTFVEGLTVLENLVFGRIANAGTAEDDRLHEVMGELLIKNGLRNEVAALIGDIGITSGGSNQSTIALERISFVRAAIRRPDILVLDQAMQTHPPHERLALRDRVRDLLPEAAIIHIEPTIEQPSDFDHVFEIASGKIEGDETLSVEDSAGRSDLAQKIAELSRASLFDTLPRSQLRLLAFASQWFETPKGAYIFREGQKADAAYLITSGSAQLHWNDVDEMEFEASIVLPGRLIGDLSVIQRSPRTLDLIAREDVRGLRIGAAEFTEVIGSDPEAAMSLLRTVSGYLTDVAEQLREQVRDGK
jgi:putative ABC transport system ATP-binding protein